MHRAWLCVVLVIVGASGTARADDDDDDPDAPRSVDIRLDRARAHLTATWHWKAIAGIRHRRFPLAKNMVVTAARFQAGGDTYELALTDLERADKQRLASQNSPVGRSRAGAIELTTEWDNLDVDFLLPATGDVELVVELDAATCFLADIRYLHFPTSWPVRASWISPDYEPPEPCRDVGPQSLENRPIWIGVPTHEASALPVERIVPRAAAMVAGGRQLARVELVRGSDLMPIPTDLHTVIVVDRSRSLSDWARAGEAVVLAAYARAVPHSQLAVVAFARTPSIVAPWGEAGDVAPAAIAALERMPLANGSNLLRGIAVADALLAHASGTRRVIVLSDDLFATSLTADRLAAAARRVRAGTIIHTVDVWSPGDALVHDDHRDAAPLAAEGESFVLEGGSNVLDARPLLRPERLDDVELALGNPAGWTRLSGPATGHLSLSSGGATTWWFSGSSRAPAVVTLSGHLWRRPWHAVVPAIRADRDIARAVITEIDDEARAALVKLDDGAVFDAAAPLAEVVDDHHALYAGWGGDGGYVDEGEMAEGYGVCGCSTGGDLAGAVGWPDPPGHPIIDGPAVLEAQLRTEIGWCALNGASGTLRVEMTGQDEIVDVAVQLSGGNPAVAHCIEEAVWATPVHMRGAARHSAVTIRL
jgi:hypothetical protein